MLEINGTQQRGRGFGRRLANALADAFAEGYDHLIVVGSDCPRLDEVDWQAVSDNVESGVPVLGPTPDREGTYLIGVSRAHFEREDFAALPWKSTSLLPALARYLRARAERIPARLDARADVNDHEDLVALLRCCPSLLNGLLARLRVLLGPTQRPRRSLVSASGPVSQKPRTRDPPSVLRD